MARVQSTRADRGMVPRRIARMDDDHESTRSRSHQPPDQLGAERLLLLPGDVGVLRVPEVHRRRALAAAAEPGRAHARDEAVRLRARARPQRRAAGRSSGRGRLRLVADVFERRCEQEQEVSRQIDALYETAFTEKAFAAVAELQWFLTEQVEEEKTGARDRREVQAGRQRPGVAARSRSRAGRRRAGARAADATRGGQLTIRGWDKDETLLLSFALSRRGCMRRHRRRRPAASAQPAANRRAPTAKIDQHAILERIKVLVGRRVRRPRAGTKGEDLTVRYLVEKSRSSGCSRATPTAPTSRRCRSSGSPAPRPQPLTVTKGGTEADVQVVRRGRRLDQARHRHRGDRQLRAGLRRLRRHRARVQLGRLQGTWTSRARRSSCWSTIRRCPTPPTRRSSIAKTVQRQGDDLLRPLDLQVREGRANGRGRRPHRPRDRPGRLSVPGRPGLPGRAIRPGHAETRTWAASAIEGWSRSMPRRRSSRWPARTSTR